MKRSLLTCAALFLLAANVHAQSNDDGERERGHRGPPAEALEACSAAIQGDTCSFEGRRGEALQGTCETPGDKPLACRPEGGPPERELERSQ